MFFTCLPFVPSSAFASTSFCALVSQLVACESFSFLPAFCVLDLFPNCPQCLALRLHSCLKCGRDLGATREPFQTLEATSTAVGLRRAFVRRLLRPRSPSWVYFFPYVGLVGTMFAKLGQCWFHARGMLGANYGAKMAVFTGPQNRGF